MKNKWLKQKTESAWKKAERNIEITIVGLSEELKEEQQTIQGLNEQIELIQSDEGWATDEDTIATFDVLTQELERRSKRVTDLFKQLDAARELKKKTKARTVNPDTVFAGLVSLASVMLVINAEKVGIITSKAFGMIVRPRL